MEQDFAALGAVKYAKKKGLFPNSSEQDLFVDFFLTR